MCYPPTFSVVDSEVKRSWVEEGEIQTDLSGFAVAAKDLMLAGVQPFLNLRQDSLDTIEWEPEGLSH